MSTKFKQQLSFIPLNILTASKSAAVSGTYLHLYECCLYVTYRNYEDVNGLALDGSFVQTHEETAFLNGQKSNSSFWTAADRVDVDDTASGQRRPSLFRCLIKVYALSLLKGHLCKLVCDLLLFVGPMLQRWVGAVVAVVTGVTR